MGPGIWISGLVVLGANANVVEEAWRGGMTVLKPDGTVWWEGHDDPPVDGMLVILTPQSMTYDSAKGLWAAEGIPTAPYDDAQASKPYPMVQVVAKNSSGQTLASATLVSKFQEAKALEEISATADTADAFSVPVATTETTGGEGGDDNNAVLLGLLAKYPKGRYSLTYALAEPSIYYHVFESDFGLKGKKLKGSWVLVRTRGGPGGDRSNWLLIKHRDEWSGPIDVTEEFPDSVKSRGDLADILSQNDPEIWTSNRPARGGQAGRLELREFAVQLGGPAERFPVAEEVLRRNGPEGGAIFARGGESVNSLDRQAQAR